MKSQQDFTFAKRFFFVTYSVNGWHWLRPWHPMVKYINRKLQKNKPDLMPTSTALY